MLPALFRNGQQAPHPDPRYPLECKETCSCELGTLTCYKYCQDPPCFYKSEVLDECGCEQCAEVCIEVDNDGIERLEGSSWMPGRDGDVCETCSCREGETNRDVKLCIHINVVLIIICQRGAQRGGGVCGISSATISANYFPTYCNQSHP